MAPYLGRHFNHCRNASQCVRQRRQDDASQLALTCNPCNGSPHTNKSLPIAIGQPVAILAGTAKKVTNSLSLKTTTAGLGTMQMCRQMWRAMATGQLMEHPKGQ